MSGRYLARRLLHAVALLLGVTFISFLLMVYFGPDKTYELVGKNPTAEQIAEVRQALGYDQPFLQRYAGYVRELVTLDLGLSDSSGEAVSSILRHVRHGRVRGVYSIGDAEAEVIEAQVLSTSPIAGQVFRDIDFPEGVRVGAVMKAGEVIRPTGGTRLDEGDVIALFSMAPDVPEVERLFQVSIDYF